MFKYIHNINKYIIHNILLFRGVENSRAYIEMQKVPTRGHQALSNEMSWPKNLIAFEIQREENERKI